MKNSHLEKLTRAIDGHHVVLLKDQAGVRVVEVYLIHKTNRGPLSLHGWQRSGASGPEPPPKWLNRHLDDILSIEVSSERFDQPHPQYNPRRFHHVMYEIDVNGPRPPVTSPAHSRVHGPKRRSPPKAGFAARRNGGTNRRQRS
jgi:hypothetical protein